MPDTWMALLWTALAAAISIHQVNMSPAMQLMTRALKAGFVSGDSSLTDAVECIVTDRLILCQSPQPGYIPPGMCLSPFNLVQGAGIFYFAFLLFGEQAGVNTL